MTDIRLPRRRDVDLVVQGATLVAEASSALPGAQRWAELRLWRAGSGVLVLEQVGRSLVEGERDRADAWACADEAEVVARLRRGGRLGWLAQELCRRAGIDAAERV